jgi:DNA-binding NarL/FixJ family response regulator
VRTSKNGKEAVEIAARCRPDLIILDFSMPMMSGLQAAKIIKAKMPDVRIILFTMHDQVILSRINAVDSFIDRVVQKTDLGKLLNHVRELLPVS